VLSAARRGRSEAFANVLTVVTLPEAGPEAFLDAAAAFCNERVWGTLSASVIVHPSLARAQPALEDRVCAALHYGCVSVNATGYVAYPTFTCVWGGHPAVERLDNLQSGLVLPPPPSSTSSGAYLSPTPYSSGAHLSLSASHVPPRPPSRIPLPCRRACVQPDRAQLRARRPGPDARRHRGSSKTR
jgi:hypothetical protein